MQFLYKHPFTSKTTACLACTRLVCVEVPEDMIVAGQTKIVRYRDTNTRQLFQASPLRMSIQRSDESRLLYGSRRTRTHSCQPKGGTYTLQCTRPLARVSPLPVLMRCELAPKSCKPILHYQFFSVHINSLEEDIASYSALTGNIGYKDKRLLGQ